MGQFNQTCFISHLPIRYEEPVVVFFCRQGWKEGIPKRQTNPTDILFPFPVYLKGFYDSYGSLLIAEGQKEELDYILSISHCSTFEELARTEKVAMLMCREDIFDLTLSLYVEENSYLKKEEGWRKKYQELYQRMEQEKDPSIGVELMSVGREEWRSGIFRNLTGKESDKVFAGACEVFKLTEVFYMLGRSWLPTVTSRYGDAQDRLKAQTTFNSKLSKMTEIMYLDTGADEYFEEFVYAIEELKEEKGISSDKELFITAESFAPPRPLQWMFSKRGEALKSELNAKYINFFSWREPFLTEDESFITIADTKVKVTISVLDKK